MSEPMHVPQGVGDIPEEELRLLLALMLIPGLGPSTFHHLLRAFGSLEGIFGGKARELAEACPRLYAATLAGILRGPDHQAVDGQLEECRLRGVDPVGYRSARYPRPLLALPQPPPLLFIRGAWLPGDSASVAVVGTRYPTRYGLRAGRDLCLGLAESGLTLVSGLARGIDTLAHETALEGGARTVAVLGCGLDRTYPPENGELADRITGSGCLISEYPFGVPPQPGNFPRRNRLISGLSLGTVVVEAGNGSGALLTARYALDQGKEIFAVPGSIYSPASRGIHELIQEGAHLVCGHTDVLRVLQGTSQAVPARRFDLAAPPSAPADEGTDREAATVPEKTAVPGTGADLATDVQEAGLDGKQKDLLRLVEKRAFSLDDLAEKARENPAFHGVSSHHLLVGLLVLELRGKVRRLPGSLFRLA